MHHRSRFQGHGIAPGLHQSDEPRVCDMDVKEFVEGAWVRGAGGGSEPGVLSLVTGWVYFKRAGSRPTGGSLPDQLDAAV
jgi:hypothetical protein